jgi:hypothetical protein
MDDSITVRTNREEILYKEVITKDTINLDYVAAIVDGIVKQFPEKFSVAISTSSTNTP